MNPANTPADPSVTPDGEDAEYELQEAAVPLSLAGKRFDQALAEMFPDFSRSRLTEWIKSGDALLDGQPARPRAPVRGGESVLLNVRTEVETTALAEDIPFEIVFEDADVLVVNKPAGLVVHPGAGNPRGTLVNALLHFDPRMNELPRAGIVHRLDKDTSGLMVVARSLRSHSALVEQLSEREVHRQYVAVVVGPMIAGGTVNAPIGRHATDRVRQAVVKEGQGREAITHYRVRERFRAHTVLECRLETGRTHQIRVHMAHAKHPLIGDPLYGGSFKLPKAATTDLVEMLRSFKRQALHAEKLAFVHPVSGETVRAHTVLECRLETGRTHQIRVHMAHAKHPLIGDPLYGGSFKLPKAATTDLVEMLRSFKRQALHAEKLAFVHPVSGETISTEAPIPADMQALIATLRADTAAHKL